jgi:putative membrane protein
MNPSRPLHSSAPLAVTFTAVALLCTALAANAAGPSRVRHVTARNLTRGFAAEPLATGELRATERSFLVKASESSRQQMRLAEVGVSQAVNSDVRSHAQQLATDYRSLNESLMELIRRRGGIPGAPVGGSSETYQKLVEQPSGDFDRAFVRTVSKATNDMLTLFEQVASDSRDPEVRDFAAAQLPVLRAHRTAATQLQKELG